MSQFANKPLKIAMGISLALALCLMALSFFYTRETVFLWLNVDLGKVADQIFSFFTLMAEGWMWIPYLLLMFGLFKKDALFILINFLLSTILTQVPKMLIWDNITRPMASGMDVNKIHHVDGIEMHL